MPSRTHTLLRIVVIILLPLAVGLVVVLSLGGFEVSVGDLVLRVQRGASYPLEKPPTSALAANTPTEATGADPDARPRNVILFIGDGLGVGHISTASALLHGPAGALAMEGTPFIGLMRTWATNNLVPDSAAAGTAMATGFKTRKKAVGVLADGRVVRNLFEAARAHGLATGVVTTSGLADATPACFTSHVASRDDYGEILQQTLDSGTEVLIGGDWARKSKARQQPRYLDLVARAEELGSARGFTVIRDPDNLESVTGPLLALFPVRGGSANDYGPPLELSTRHALRLLGEAPQGFVLMIESEVTDESAHDNDIATVMDGVRELDRAVALALELSAARGDTLVLVTADHGTGGLTVTDGRYERGRATIRWVSDYHTAEWVPLFAFGPGAEAFTGVFDNTELAPRIARLLDLEPLPKLAESVTR
ncbi:MAG: alkaline phosphatase [Thermoanaerobaculales bacterium]